MEKGSCYGRCHHLLLSSAPNQIFGAHKQRGRLALREDSLALAAGAKVALEALAQARGVIADATAGTIAAEVVTLTEQHVRAGWALLKRAVRATGAQITDTADVLVGIPRRGVRLRGLVRELLLLDAAAAVVAVAGARGALARLAVVAVKALALAGLAVAGTTVRALLARVGLVVARGVVDPGVGLGARALGAVVLRPRGVVVLRACVARALVVLAARTVAGAAVGAVGGHERQRGEEDEDSLHRFRRESVCDLYVREDKEVQFA